MHRPRENRDMYRANDAVARAKAAGAHIIDAVCAGAHELNPSHPASVANRLKLDTERLIRKSFGHPEVRARFRFYVERIAEFGLTLDQACEYMRRECAERRREPVRLPSMIRNELHLILRWMRFRKMHAAFGETVAAMRVPYLEAAE